MAIYDTTAPADPFARSRLRFESLVGDLSGGRAGQMTHDLLEEPRRPEQPPLGRGARAAGAGTRAGREAGSSPATAETARNSAGRAARKSIDPQPIAHRRGLRPWPQPPASGSGPAPRG